ncbi:MAG: hypothetical protein CMJ48_06945, partial [Planctomycetaceae bacterium]|nr:hypothetical protein [Planctomycetaceae bacterium]
ANVSAARERLLQLGLTGKVSVEQLRDGRLPYADGIVNLLIGEDLDGVGGDEIMRALCPEGVAYVKTAEGWSKTIKPRPDAMDEWTHFLHDASGNAVAQDALVGPPRHMQWQAAPSWLRSHHTLASVGSVVSAKGRLFYVVDESPAASISIAPKWFVAARDAFNGVPLWKRDIATWANHLQKFRSGPVQMQRLLVTDGDTLFVPLGVDAPVSALDAATGEIVRTYKATQHVEEIVLTGGVLYAVTGIGNSEQAFRAARLKGAPLPAKQKTIVAVDPASGRLLWKWPQAEGAEVMPLTLAATAEGVFFQEGTSAFCLEPKTGAVRWNVQLQATTAAESVKVKTNGKKGKNRNKNKNRSRDAGWSVATLVVNDDVVLLASGGKLRALTVAEGKQLWETPAAAGFKSPPDVLVAAGLVWLGPNFSAGLDPQTGEIKQHTVSTDDLWTTGHHHRCYRNKGTEQYLMSGKRGIEFFDLVGENHSRNNWIRGLCQYGVMPCNGLVYAPPHACGCFMESKLYGFWALAPEKPAPIPPSRADRLEKGPAYGQVEQTETAADDWPTLRHDALRTGVTNARLPKQLQTTWTTRLAGRLSAPVAADGTVLVSQVDAHRVVALDATSGAVRWSYIAGGRVDSPPTILQGTALFGSADGYVHCVRMSDGELVWRLLAAHIDRRTVSFDQLESLWPVHGNILVQDGVAYFAAGRSSHLDGGITMFAVDPSTGNVLYERKVRDEHAYASNVKAGSRKQLTQNATDSKTFEAVDKSDAFSMKGATTDVLVGDGTSVYMRHLRFSREMQPVEGRALHLFSTSKLIDDNQTHRSHWVLGSGNFSRTPVAYSWIANKADIRKGTVAYGYKLSVPYGLMLCYDEETAWGVKRTGGGRPGGSYLLFATANAPVSTELTEAPDFRRAAAVKSVGLKWSADLALHPRAMLRAGDRLVLGGTSDLAGEKPLLIVADGGNGQTSATHALSSAPVWDGMAVATGRLFVATQDGSVVCLSGN